MSAIDDGVGPPSGERALGHGLRNLATRAVRLGGSVALRPNVPTGTVLEWRVPRG